MPVQSEIKSKPTVMKCCLVILRQLIDPTILDCVKVQRQPLNSSGITKTRDYKCLIQGINSGNTHTALIMAIHNSNAHL
jgi:hypothetical protein